MKWIFFHRFHIAVHAEPWELKDFLICQLWHVGRLRVKFLKQLFENQDSEEDLFLEPWAGPLVGSFLRRNRKSSADLDCGINRNHHFRIVQSTVIHCWRVRIKGLCRGKIFQSYVRKALIACQNNELL